MSANEAWERAAKALTEQTRPGSSSEAARLAALQGYDILDSVPEPAFDELARLAAQIVGTPVALISLVDEHRLWFKSRLGFADAEMPRAGSFCAHAIDQDGQKPQLMIVPDARRDPRFINNPAVMADPPIRFYAGAPLVAPGQHLLGTLCVIDQRPRALTPEQEEALMMLARQVIGQMELRLAMHKQAALMREREQSHLRELAERHAATEALRRSNERYQAVLRATQDVVWDWDFTQGKMSWSERLGPALGHAAAALPELPAWKEEQLHPDDRARVAASLKAALDSRAPSWSAEYQFRRGNGTYAHVLDRATLSYDADGQPLRLVGAICDLTEQRELQAQLSLAERMATVGTLAAGVAHEINNPLSYMLANLKFALESLEDHPLGKEPDVLEMRKALEEAEEGAQRVRLIVKEMKTFSRGDEESVGPLDVHLPLESAMMMAGNDIHHHAQLIRDYGALPKVQANEARLAQVFLNLLVNAVQALPDDAPRRNEIRVATRVAGPGQVVVEISDNGAGIPTHLRSRIFEPFFTTKPIGTGTGLGLSVCHRLITQLRGTIEVDSDPGRGSTFRIFLPVAEATATPG